MLYTVRFNMALAALGYDPQTVKQTYRLSAVAMGKANGNTPQESALILVTMFPMGERLKFRASTVAKWAKARKIDPDKREVLEAALELDCLDEARAGSR